jgi:hypothetical protein
VGDLINAIIAIIVFFILVIPVLIFGCVLNKNEQTSLGYSFRDLIKTIIAGEYNA